MKRLFDKWILNKYTVSILVIAYLYYIVSTCNFLEAICCISFTLLVALLTFNNSSKL